MLGEDLVQSRLVANIPLLERPPANKFFMAIGEIVENDRFVAAFCKQQAGVRANISGPADNENFLPHPTSFQKETVGDCVSFCRKKGRGNFFGKDRKVNARPLETEGRAEEFYFLRIVVRVVMKPSAIAINSVVNGRFPRAPAAMASTANGAVASGDAIGARR